MIQLSLVQQGGGKNSSIGKMGSGGKCTEIERDKAEVQHKHNRRGTEVWWVEDDAIADPY